MAVLTRRDTRDPLFNVLDRMFHDPFFNGDVPATMTRLEEGFLPVDVSETDTHVLIRAAVPGFRKEDIEAEIHDNVLTVKAEQKETREEQGERYFRKELRFGSMSRRIALPSAVVAGEVAAELRDGVLTLRVPKVPEATPRKIKIG
jgi:HSP20 family protein